MLPLIDTHTHFDLSVYEAKRFGYVARSLKNGVQHVVLIGLAAQYFARMTEVANKVAAINVDGRKLGVHLAMGLHPVYIDEHDDKDLQILADYLAQGDNIAIAEIGLDTFLPHLKVADVFAKQIHFFVEQIELAKCYQLPVILHIRKAHAQVLNILKKQHYDAHQLGGIAHSFSGGEEEAKAFVKMGFKLGITGQITNPNAKKLHRALRAAVDFGGIQTLVIETDCPDMMPLPCQSWGDLNEPANLPYVLSALSEILAIDSQTLSEQLWQNTQVAFKRIFTGMADEK